MSWASHNPEKWSEIVNTGITNKLASMHSLTDEFSWLEILTYVEELEVGTVAQRTVYEALMNYSLDEITQSHSDYISSLIDSVERSNDV